MQDFRKLQVWEKSHALVLEIYRHTSGFPKHELFCLTSQLRRSSTSIPANIAEGCGRHSDPDFVRFLQIAFGSATETEYHLLLSRDLCYISEPDYEFLNNQIVEVKKMLTSLMSKVRQRTKP